MERWTLREAAERTARSVTTLRRYIRSGRLRAEKRHGRYGPEYLVCAEDLARAGLEPQSQPPALPRNGLPAADPLVHALHESVPLSLYHELQMKHEQLLVQYGMVRAGGLRALELQAEVEALRRQLAERQRDLELLQQRLERETRHLRRRLHEAHLELEGRRIEAAALREKMRALEALARPPAPREPVEQQVIRLVRQAERVDRMTRGEKEDPSEH